MYECKECGYKTENIANGTDCPICNKPMEETGKKKKAKNVFSVKSILITALAIVVGKFAGGYLADMMMKDKTTDEIKSDMDSFIEQTEKYVPGKTTANGYESDYWGITFTPDENWIEMESYDLAEVDREMSASVKASAVSAVEQAGMDKEFVKKYKETMFCEVEAGYYGVADDIVVGELLIASYSGYTGGQHRMVVDESLTQLENELKDAKRGKAYFDNKAYDYVDGVLTEDDDMTIRVRAYMKTQGVMINVIRLDYIEGYEEIVESFENLVVQKN
ncbi:MAG: hypothetical protein E7406_07925 [Ruminococcaceae bacterium]|nr:hypothetical protein [Oscillospiraceae bacterium]